VFYAQRLGHRNSHDQTARLERPGRQSAFVLDQDFTAAELFRKARHHHDRRHRFAEADDIFGFANGQQFAIAPKVRRPVCQRLLAQRLANAREIVTHEQRLAGTRQVVNLVGLVAFSGHRAFEMGDKTRKSDRQIVIVLHAGTRSYRALASSVLMRRTFAEHDKM
jgi:hypothetical protein